MRFIKGLLVCLFMVLAAMSIAANAMPYTEFRSTSAYISSTSGNTGYARSSVVSVSSGLKTASYATYRTTGSMVAISAANFATLNSEGGACYQPSSITKPQVRRGGRDDEEEEGDGGNAIGEYDFHSPVGATPWILMVVLAAAYLFIKRRKFSTSLAHSDFL